jgi:uncharacterized protein YkwD
MEDKNKNKQISFSDLVHNKLNSGIKVISVAFIVFAMAFGMVQIRAYYQNKAFKAEVIFKEINLVREKNKLPPLSEDQELNKVAMSRALDMKAKNYFGHQGPNGVSWIDSFKEQGYNYTYAGENLARGYNNEKELVANWMASQTHKENILFENFDKAGIAIVESKEGNIIVNSFSKF